MANTYLERIIEAGSVGRTFTYSVWFKRTKTGTSTQLWNLSSDDDSSKYIEIAIKSDDKLDMQFRNGTSGDNGTYIRRIPTRVFRDSNAFYHVVLRFDSTESSADDRFRLYINGEQETSFSTSTGTIPQNYVTDLANTGGEHRIGRGSGGNTGGAYFEGSMSHFHFVDGQSYAPTVFGSTDSTTGEWKINTSPSISTANYGTNGFFILKDGNSVTDQSGNSHNFTVAGGTLTKTEDNPSNVFATANPLDGLKGSAGILKPTFSNGNLTLSSSAGLNYQTFGTLAVDTGKYYWETKATDCDGHRVGVFFGDNKVHGGTYYYGANAFYIHQNGQIYYNGANTVYMSSLSDGDIVGVALDRTNGHIYLHKNGQYADGNGNNDQTFANAVSINTKLGVTMPSDITYPFFDVYGTAIMDINFGNGYFGTTAVASAGTNASGIGIFEYDVPTGYTALSTKGLNL